MPSGSDAEYIPLLIAKTLNKGKKIVTICTCVEEVGSGTVNAASGKLFSNLEPIVKFADGSAKKDGDPVAEFNEGIQTVSILAREPSGEVVNPTPETEKTLKACKDEGSVPILHTVYGSKTGICEKFPDEFNKQVMSMNGVTVLDACQGRFSNSVIHDALTQEACILYTGSKFYRSPPFCGAIFIPAPIMKRLQEEKDFKMPKGLHTFFGKSEVPKELDHWRAQCNDSCNYGLALRWEAGLAEMEPTLKIDETERVSKTAEWRKAVVEMVGKHDNLNYFEAAYDTDSIISIRIKNTGDERPWFNKSELAKVFKAMTLDMSAKFPDNEIAKHKCFIGQPVLISKTEAVLRIAQGSDSLRAYISDPAASLAEDQLIVNKMAYLGSKFADL